MNHEMLGKANWLPRRSVFRRYRMAASGTRHSLLLVLLLEGRFAKGEAIQVPFDLDVDGLATEESDGLILPANRANKTGTPAAEHVEGRGSAKGNEIPMATRRTLYRVPCGVCGDRVRKVSRVATDRHIPEVGAV